VKERFSCRVRNAVLKPIWESHVREASFSYIIFFYLLDDDDEFGIVNL